MPFISSPYMTASPFSEISHDNIPASLRDVHRTYICGGFLCDMHRSIGDVFVWCAQNYQRWFVWDARRCQWQFVCDAHRSIRDGLCVNHTDLSVMVYVWCAQNYQRWFLCDAHRSITVSVMVCMWCAQIYQLGWQPTFHQLSAHTPSPPPAPNLISLPLPPFSMILHYDIPDGLCVMRTALSVVFTCCPPAPVARNVSISRSLGFTLMSICKTICCLSFSGIIIFGTFTVKIHYTRQLY